MLSRAHGPRVAHGTSHNARERHSANCSPHSQQYMAGFKYHMPDPVMYFVEHLGEVIHELSHHVRAVPLQPAGQLVELAGEVGASE